MANKGFSQSALGDAQIRIARALSIPGESAAPDYFGEMRPMLQMGRADRMGYAGSGVSRGRSFGIAVATSLGAGVATGFILQPRVDAILTGQYFNTVDSITGLGVPCNVITVLVGPEVALTAGASLPADSTLSRWLERPVGDTETAPLKYVTGGALSSTASKISVGITPAGGNNTDKGQAFVAAGASLGFQFTAAADCSLVFNVYFEVF